jgi:hypothetical protein
MEKDEIVKIRDEYSDMYNIAAYTKPVEYAVFLENKILALNSELRQANDFITKQENAFLYRVIKRGFSEVITSNKFWFGLAVGMIFIAAVFL